MSALESDLIATAQTLAGDAVLNFFGALIVLLAAVLVVVWTIKRYAAAHVRARMPPAVFLGLCLGLGAAFIVLAALGFLLIAEELGADRVISRFDQAFSHALRLRSSPEVRQLFGIVTHFGDPLVLLLICISVALALLRFKRHRLAWAWVIAVSGNAVLNRTLKEVFERIRPLDEHGYTLAQGWSFPSGHTSGAVITYGMLAYIALHTLPPRWHSAIIGLATTIAFTVGCSRIFLQAHFPSDVVAGFLSGSAWLAICVGTIEFARFYRPTPR